jgi:hypothetical protein
MVNKQQIKNPFKLHQNWRQIKNDVNKKLKTNAHPDAQNHLVVDEAVIPTMSDIVFKKLVMLQAADPQPKRKKYVIPDQISIQDAKKVVRELLRNKGIESKDRKLMLVDIMVELKQYTEQDQIDFKIVKKITYAKIKKIGDIKQQMVSHKSYLQEFIEGWKKRFHTQISSQEWNPVN